MGRKRSGVNKTAAIKDYLSSNPDAGPKDVAAALTDKGLKVTAQYVSTIKSKLGLGGATGGTKKRRGRPPAAATGKKAPGAVAYDSLVAARNFVRSVGGVDRARGALEAYAELQ